MVMGPKWRYNPHVSIANKSWVTGGRNCEKGKEAGKVIIS